jgi:hypothetical protein
MPTRSTTSLPLPARARPAPVADPGNSGGGRPARHDLLCRRAAGRRDLPRLRPGRPRLRPAVWPHRGRSRLRERIADELSSLGLDCGPERVLVLSGSQQGIDLVGKLFIDPGTPVAVESPTYLAALQVFRFFGARFAPSRRRRWAQADLATAGRPLPTPSPPSRTPPAAATRRRAGSPGENLR